MKDVCDLIVRYDNVYADVSHHRVLTPKGRSRSGRAVMQRPETLHSTSVMVTPPDAGSPMVL